MFYDIREAVADDIAAMHVIRMSVQENKLNNPLLVTPADYLPMITQEGKGWVCTIDNLIVGFAIIDVSNRNIWALFVHPDWEAKGIGKRLHNKMINWYFNNYKEKIWLSTAPNTRAEKFYNLLGWTYTGQTKGGEARFEMSAKNYSDALLK